MILDNFQNSVRSTSIKSATLSLEDLKKLYEIVNAQNDEAKGLQLEHIAKHEAKANAVYPKEEVEEVKNKILEKYVVGIEIFTSKGQYLRFYNPEDAFDKNKIPDNIDRIIISNTLLFNLQRDLIQPYKIIIDLDFSRTTLLDVSSNPTHETYNPSKIEVWGLKESWTEGVHQKLLEFYSERTNKRYWLHRKNIYDLFLWTLLVPVLFWNLYKIDIWLNEKISGLSSVLITFIYIYIFIVGLLFFNLLFKYLRRTFPPMELKSNLNTKSKIIRVIILTVVSGIGLKILTDVIFSLISFLL